MTEQQVYTLVDQRKGYELREYAPVAIAAVAVSGNLQSAPYQGFNSLFRYISSNNIAMTSPVIQRENAADRWTIEFVMPAGAKAEDLPVGTAQGVEVRQQPAQLCAVVALRGGLSNPRVLRKVAELRAAIERDGIKITGELQVARFNSPFMPVPLRYSEIRYPVAQ